MSLRDPRAFRVLVGDLLVPTDDEQLQRIYRGDRLGSSLLSERYSTGDTIPADVMPSRSVSGLIGRGRIEPVAGPPAATAAATELARVAEVELGTITPSGKGGKVTAGDVRSHLDALDADTPGEVA